MGCKIQISKTVTAGPTLFQKCAATVFADPRSLRSTVRGIVVDPSTSEPFVSFLKFLLHARADYCAVRCLNAGVDGVPHLPCLFQVAGYVGCLPFLVSKVRNEQCNEPHFDLGRSSR